MDTPLLVYALMYAVPAVSTLAIGAGDPGSARRHRLGMALLLLAFTVLIGLRYQVGTDWFNYQRTVNQLTYTSFAGTFAYKDPGFGVLTWISTRLGWGIYGADVFCGAVLMMGLRRFAVRQPDAWLAVTAAVPYLVVVVGMGYVRQAASIGFILLALSAFEERRYLRFAAWMTTAVLFHGPALCVLPLVAAAIARRRAALLFPLLLIAGILFPLLLAGRVDELYRTYIEKEYDSSGAGIRLFMNAIPAALFLLRRHTFAPDDANRFFWTLAALVALALFAALPLFPSSTALDRVGLYFIPVQLFVFGRLPSAFGRTPQGIRIVSYLVVLYYGAALFVWLLFASNAHAWLPYRFAPFAG